jgi:cysteinyl-tRNA synthetase
MAKGLSGREVRYLLITAHYRETFNFTLEGLAGAKTALARIDECVGKLSEIADRTNGAPNSKILEQFSAALDDDLNISAAWGEIFKWVTETNKRIAENSLQAADAAASLAAWHMIDSVLGVGTKNDIEIPADITALAEDRIAAKKSKDFKRSDAIRDELKAKGWVIEDSPKGYKLKKL